MISHKFISVAVYKIRWSLTNRLFLRLFFNFFNILVLLLKLIILTVIINILRWIVFLIWFAFLFIQLQLFHQLINLFNLLFLLYLLILPQYFILKLIIIIFINILPSFYLFLLNLHIILIRCMIWSALLRFMIALITCPIRFSFFKIQSFWFIILTLINIFVTIITI